MRPHLVARQAQARARAKRKGPGRVLDRVIVDLAGPDRGKPRLQLSPVVASNCVASRRPRRSESRSAFRPAAIRIELRKSSRSLIVTRPAVPVPAMPARSAWVNCNSAMRARTRGERYPAPFALAGTGRPPRCPLRRRSRLVEDRRHPLGNVSRCHFRCVPRFLLRDREFLLPLRLGGGSGARF